MALTPLAGRGFQQTPERLYSARDNIMVIGSRSEAREFPGPAALIDEDQVCAEAATELDQLLETGRTKPTATWSWT